MALEEGWIIKQKNQVWGDATLFLTGKAIKMKYESQGFCLVAQGPEWNYTLYSDQAKIRCPVDYDKLKKHIFSSFSKLAYGEGDALPQPTGKTGSLLGIKVFQYEARPLSAPGTATTQANSAYDAKHPPKLVRSEYWLAKNLGVPPQGCKVIAAGAAVPPMQGLVLKVRYLKKDGQWEMGTDTVSARRAPIDDKEFHVPVGYKQVKRPEQVIFSDADLINSFVGR